VPVRVDLVSNCPSHKLLNSNDRHEAARSEIRINSSRKVTNALTANKTQEIGSPPEIQVRRNRILEAGSE